LVAWVTARIGWLAAVCGLDIDHIERVVQAVAVGTDGVIDATAEPDPCGPGLVIGLYES
jgi:hypothetical protein